MNRLLEEPLVGLTPLLDGFEALTLVAGELEVDLASRDDSDLGQLDHRDGFVIEVEHDAQVARASIQRIPPLEQARSRRLLAPQDSVDELAPQVGAGIAELELRQLRQWTSASRRGSRRACGSRSTWRSCHSVNASRPQSWREKSSLPATWRSISVVTASGRKKP